ncbi:MAG: DUF58 domain-containing protein [archaeon]
MIDTAYLQQLRRFDLIVKKRVTSKYTGARSSVAEGRGILFKDHRIYVPGDDIRLVDWKVFARTDDLYLKRYEEERNLEVHIVLDASNSMNFGKVKKFDYASMLGVGFAYLSMKNNEKFRFSTFADDLQSFKSKRGMGQLASMVDFLNNLQMGGAVKFDSMAARYKKLIQSRSVIFVISDFMFPVKAIKDGLAFLSKHDVSAIQVLDPVEKNLSLQGDFKLKDLETNELLRAYITPRLKQNYRERLNQHNLAIEQECGKLGVKFYSFTTDMSIFDAFHEILRR